jgi:hypothetical protein
MYTQSITIRLLLSLRGAFSVTTRRPLLAIFLAFLLLLTQQMAFAHAIYHLSGHPTGNEKVKQLPAEKVCHQCLAFAQIDTAIQGEAPLAALAPAFSENIQRVPAQCPAAETFCDFQSRAPPASH